MSYPLPDPSANDALHAVATFNGWQDMRQPAINGFPSIDVPPAQLWTLAAPVPGLTVGSTYTRATIERALNEALTR